MNTSSKVKSAFVIVTSSEKETMELGRRIGGLLGAGDVVALLGSLGAGKTTLVKGLAVGLGIDDVREVRSASFLLIAEYKARVPIYHFDAYRLESAEEMYGLGCEEIFWGEGVSIIEWADRVEECLPENYLRISMSIEGPASRKVVISIQGNGYGRVISGLKRGGS
ncbi:MAG: tRNA (adenosine(37)-N6)-threonylcarbamoyltransferase complex ATPase subunit type 1 TsaE [Planctomycetota bacterium]